MINALVVLISVVFLDVLLSGDNAVVIGMAANTLPKVQRNTAIFLGMVVAALARIIFSLFAVSLLKYRAVSIAGGFVLLWVIYKLVKDILAEKKEEEGSAPEKPRKSLLSTIGIIAAADISMSLDNVLAVAALARNNPFILVIGLVTSIALLGFGAKLVSKLLEKWPWLSWVGAALIFVIALELIFGVRTV